MIDRVQAMRIFVRIVDTNSFTRAAESLEVPRATATTTVQALESLLGVQLLVRTTRKVTLTAEGAAYYDAARRFSRRSKKSNRVFSTSLKICAAACAWPCRA